MTYDAGPAALRGEHTIFYVGEDAENHHIVHENHGLHRDFVSREEAICFAQQSAAQVPGAIVMIAPKLVDVARRDDDAPPSG